MKTRIEKKCTNCKERVFVHFEQVCGIRIIREKDGKQYYSAKCPNCNFEWKIKK